MAPTPADRRLAEFALTMRRLYALRGRDDRPAEGVRSETWWEQLIRESKQQRPATGGGFGQ
jgi:hypothetical protein